jgi:hypothetical protein
MFKLEDGPWAEYRKLEPRPMEVDFHYPPGTRKVEYWDAMDAIRERAFEAIKKAQADGVKWVLFTHGWSTSVGWKQTTARSQVRGLMRSKEATPYIVRSECIQHESVFVAAIRTAHHMAQNNQLAPQL